MESIKLNFINHSNDQNNSEVVIFQKNEATGLNEIAVAWTVIRNCGQGSNHPFQYPMSTQVNAGDSYGNFTPHLDAEKGQNFRMVQTKFGDKLELSDSEGSPKEISIGNSLNVGAISANVYKDGRLIASKTGVVPAEKAVFELKPTLFIGVISQVVEGAVMNAAILSSINTEISLLGIASADIIMTGGGVGPSATAFKFTLDNLVYA